MTARRPRLFPAAATWALLSAAATPARADAVGEAQALFDQGIADLKAERYPAACQELAASLAKHPDSGTKGALAVCLTHLGKTASAWQLWRDLADTAPTPDLRADATAKAAALEPRLARYVVTLVGPAPAGLVVTVNDSTVDPAVRVPLPVDPGPVRVRASAPDHDAWSDTAQASEGAVTTIAVPDLVEHPAAPPPVAAATDDTAARRHQRRAVAIGLAAGAGVALVAGGVFGVRAHGQLADAKSACGGALDACPGASFAAAQADYRGARTSAVLSDVGFVVGGLALAGAAIVWATTPAATHKLGSRGEIGLAPAAAPHALGLALAGAW